MCLFRLVCELLVSLCVNCFILGSCVYFLGLLLFSIIIVIIIISVSVVIIIILSI